MSSQSKIEIDRLQLYFEKPVKINDQITIYQPTVGQIMDYGEKAFYKGLNIFITNTTANRLTLWDIGLDWNKVSDFELFASSVQAVDKNVSKYIFGDVDFSGLKGLYTQKKRGTDNEGNEIEIEEHFLYDAKTGLKITEDDYLLIAQYLRFMFNMNPKSEKVKGKTAKEWIIEEERQKLIDEEKNKKENDYSSILLPLISACVNHPGFKYKKKELIDVGIVEFMDSVRRLSLYESSIALLRGSYSGMVDTSKINKEELNFMRDIEFN